jgi:hypothetical protein
VNGWTVPRLLAPRLTYRARFGHWCDHRTYYAGAPWNVPDDADLASGRVVSDVDTDMVPVNRGWSDWEMIDLGRAKIRSCRRCGYVETTMGHPMRDMAKELADRPAIRGVGAVLLVVGLLALVVWLMIWVFPLWLDVAMFVGAVIFGGSVRR